MAAPESKVKFVPRCVHCAIRAGTWRRGLCRRCHADKAIRRMYPKSEREKDVPPPEDFNGPGKRPSYRLDAKPGSERKIFELVQRARQRMQLFDMEDFMSNPKQEERVLEIASHLRPRDRLIFIRRHRGYTEEQLDFRAGLKEGWTMAIEGGRVTPTQEQLRRLAEALGITPSHLQGESRKVI